MVEQKLQHDQLGVYFVERQDGKSLVKDVAVNDVGQIPEPPEGFRRFFSDDYDEMMVIAEMAAAHAKKALGA